MIILYVVGKYRYRHDAERRIYLPCAMPQPLGSSGGHMGIGSMLVRATVTLLWVEAEEVWVVATAPERTRTTTKARITSFIFGPFGGTFNLMLLITI
jgi:hypothetical protein